MLVFSFFLFFIRVPLFPFFFRLLKISSLKIKKVLQCGAKQIKHKKALSACLLLFTTWRERGHPACPGWLTNSKILPFSGRIFSSSIIQCWNNDKLFKLHGGNRYFFSHFGEIIFVAFSCFLDYSMLKRGQAKIWTKIWKFGGGWRWKLLTDVLWRAAF